MEVLLIVALLAATQPEAPFPTGACPETRAYIEPSLETRPEDGDSYRIQREAIHMRIDDILAMMGGVERAYAIAEATRESARQRLPGTARGAERRSLRDTILRADALLAILDCRLNREDA